MPSGATFKSTPLPPRSNQINDYACRGCPLAPPAQPFSLIRVTWFDVVASLICRGEVWFARLCPVTVACLAPEESRTHGRTPPFTISP